MPDVALLLVDPQARVMPAIAGGEAALARMRFLAEVARFLGIPVWATRQNPDRLGDLPEELPRDETWDKMSFSAAAVLPPTPRQIILAGVETHICVWQTARDLATQGREVTVASDAVGARDAARHGAGLEALTRVATPLHSEAVAYHWLGTADHPAFRDVLRLVKGV